MRAALESQFPLHPAREISTERQSEPKAFLRLRQRAIELDERLENLLVTSFRNPGPGVFDADRDSRVARRCRRQRDASSGRGKSNRIRQQVEHDLTHLLP